MSSSTVGVSDSESGAITTLSSSSSDTATDNWQAITQQVNTFMRELPSFLDEFWSSYRLPILAIVLALGLIVLLKILFAVLGAINDLPLLSPLFELVGISYVAWFVIRYLLPGSGRQELGDTINSLKTQVVGGGEKLFNQPSNKE